MGQTGPQGPIGPAGPTITTFNSFRTLAGVDIGPAGTPVTVMSLSSGTSGGGPIKLPFAGRIFVSGSVTVFSTNANGSRIFCWLVIGTDASAPEINTFSAVDLPATNGVSASLPVVGSVSEPAGTYDLSVVCNLNGPGAASFFLGNLVAWAVPT